MDHDAQVLEDIARAVTTVDKRYRSASALDKLTLKGPRDQAFNAYRRARVNLLADGVLATAADVRKMEDIRAQIGRARAAQTTIVGIAKFVAFVAKFA